MPELPMPFRAALGLVATAADEARRLPDHAVEWPMLAVSTALQLSMRAQQRYAELAARGDELITARQPVSDDAPPWARFDDGPGAAGNDGPGSGSGDAGSVAPAPFAAGTASVRRPRHTPPSRFDAVGDDFDDELGDTLDDALGGDIDGPTPSDVAGDTPGDEQ